MLRQTVIVGANGRLGRKVAHRAEPSTRLLGVRRSADPAADTPIGDEGFLKPEDLAGKYSVVNCAGIASGDEETLLRTNVTLAENLARQAKAAGVRHFVHISSFSVFGRVDRIDGQTATGPTTPYGKSKLQAEQRLLALQDDAFAVTCIRLPFMFGTDSPSLLATLTKLLRKFPIMPVPPRRIERSMMTYDDAAYAVGEVVEHKVTGVVNCADPTLFSFDLLRRSAGGRIRLLRLPSGVFTVAGRLSPRLRESLFASNVLTPGSNFARDMNLPLGLERAIADLYRRVRERGEP